MIDQNSQFFAILTAIGEAKQANADALGIPWKITEMGVGDANGTDPIPNRLQTQLINERRRRPLNQLKIDPANAAVIVAEQIIPADEGGWWIREIGLYDQDGDLIAVANCAPSFKPILAQGAGRTQIVRMNFVVTSTGNIVLKIDPSVVLATREYVDTKISEELSRQDYKNSVLVATTANISLAGALVLDGVAVPAGARVLVKNQAAAKDNGIWVAAAGAWSRAVDADSSAKVTSGLTVPVETGTAQADTVWQLITDGPIVLGSTALVFQNITDGLARTQSPTFTGSPKAPTAPQFDSSQHLATTEFVQRAQGNYKGFISLTAASVLAVNSFGSIVSCIGSFTVTLPTVSSGATGGTISFRNIGPGPVAVVCAGADMISSGDGLVTSLVLPAGTNLELTGNGQSSWWAAGSAQLGASSIFKGQYAVAGFQPGPNGYIEQWVQIKLGEAGTGVVTYPQALSEVYGVVPSVVYGGRYYGVSIDNTPGLTSCAFRASSALSLYIFIRIIGRL